jgi:hypothetical protein
MTNIIMYYTSEVSLDMLKCFECNHYTPIAYGQLNNQFWFVYGRVDEEVNVYMKCVLHDINAFRHAYNIDMSYGTILEYLHTFSIHIKDKNSHIEVEGTGNGNLIRYTQKFIELSINKVCQIDNNSVYVI